LGPATTAVAPILDGGEVSSISSALESAYDLSTANRLSPRFRYSQGTDLYGPSFVKSSGEWDQFLAVEPAIRDFLRPYVNAEILCS
jgi:hypothetical protein